MRINVLIILLTTCAGAFACTCGYPNQAKTMRDVAEWYGSRPDVSLIFEGKVAGQEVRTGFLGAPQGAMSITPGGRYREVSFEVTRVFRGEKQQQITVLTGFGDADCGYDFETGHTYLVYATGQKGSWLTSLCSGTSAIEDAGTALRVLQGADATAEDRLSPKEYEKQYYQTIRPQRTGSVCGLVLKPDGSPLPGAIVELWELRDGELPPHTAADENTSTAEGQFCIEGAVPGRYLLTAEESDFRNDARYMAFYPGTSSRAEAVQLNISAGIRLPEVKFTTSREHLYTIHIRVVAPDGTPLSYKNGCGIRVDSEYRDPLSYHIDHGLDEDGSYTFGYIPAGKYIVQTYFDSDFDSKTGQLKPFPEASRWKQASREVVVSGDTNVVIEMEPAK